MSVDLKNYLSTLAWVTIIQVQEMRVLVSKKSVWSYQWGSKTGKLTDHVKFTTVRRYRCYVVSVSSPTIRKG